MESIKESEITDIVTKENYQEDNSLIKNIMAIEYEKLLIQFAGADLQRFYETIYFTRPNKTEFIIMPGIKIFNGTY